MTRTQIREFAATDIDDATAEVAVLVQDGATGEVAVDDDGLACFLLGGSKASGTWGENVWIEGAGQAVTDAETVRDLYAAAATRWAADGRDAHYVLVPAYDPALVDAEFRLGFGQQHVHAVREVPESSSSPAPAKADGVSVRTARREDIPVLAELDPVLPRHQGLSPVFSSGGIPTLQEATEDWEESFDNKRFAYLVAEHGGRVVGAAVGCALEKSSSHTPLTRPDKAGFLGFAAVLPGARGLGAGRALGEAVLDWTRDEGFTSAATDWRATNLLSSRTWPRLGFRPTFLRLHRRLGH